MLAWTSWTWRTWQNAGDRSRRRRPSSQIVNQTKPKGRKLAGVSEHASGRAGKPIARAPHWTRRHKAESQMKTTKWYLVATPRDNSGSINAESTIPSNMVSVRAQNYQIERDQEAMFRQRSHRLCLFVNLIPMDLKMALDERSAGTATPFGVKKCLAGQSKTHWSNRR
jgi:hypothetical protein